MHDLKWIRENPQAFDAALEKRGEAPRASEILDLDAKWREILQAVQDAQSRRNTASKEIGKAKGQGDEAGAQALIDEVAALKESIQQGEEEQRRLNKELTDLLAGLPNAPLDDVPVGEDESANALLREWGDRPKFDFAVKQHFEIGETLGLMDFETAAKLSGSRFVVLKGALARLERALASFMLDIHTTEYGYEETLPPALVRDEALFGTGQLPKFEEDLFRTGRSGIVDDLLAQLKSAVEEVFSEQSPLIEGSDIKKVSALEMRKLLSEKLGPWTEHLSDSQGLPHKDYFEELAAEAAKRYVDLWLIPTAEVPLTNLAREDIAAEDDLPRRVTAWTPCFRAEAGAAGRDTRGMIRQHQFSKVELVSITTPEQSLDELERMTACAETVLQRLELPYRVMTLSTGDMGFAAAKTYDIEVWLPGQDAYREISSCSVCGDFQARRMTARYRAKDNPKDIRYVHTLNGSGLAVGRAMIAILENFQNADGSVTIPQALRPYMGGLDRIAAG